MPQPAKARSLRLRLLLLRRSQRPMAQSSHPRPLLTRSSQSQKCQPRARQQLPSQLRRNPLRTARTRVTKILPRSRRLDLTLTTVMTLRLIHPRTNLPQPKKRLSQKRSASRKRLLYDGSNVMKTRWQHAAKMICEVPSAASWVMLIPEKRNCWTK
jgi:hypothetical protein